LDTVKIDRSFILDIPASSQDMEIVQAIIVMAHTLKLKVVTEGVETIGQLEFLSKFGCDYVQGYLFSKPSSLEDLKPLVQQLNQRKPVDISPSMATLEAARQSMKPLREDHVEAPLNPRADRFRSKPLR
jgi:predicted signal transduction protein with EAL and GGDEF domain